MDNAFDLLKLIGAFIVVLSHSFRHFGIAKPPISLFFTDGATGVMIFFAITGFVMMPSWERWEKSNRSYFAFLLNRFIRIYPLLWFSFLVITVANVILKQINIFSLSYLIYAVKYCVFFVDSAFGGAGFSNGVLWTLLPDMVFYIFTPLVYRVMKDQKTSVWLAVIFVFWQFNIWDFQTIALFQRIPFFGRFVNIGFPLCFMYEFLIGSFLYFKRNTILAFFIANKKWVILWLAAFTVFFELYNYSDLIPKTGEMHTPWLGIMTAPLAILLAFALGKVRFKVELSYCIFLFHMIIVGILKCFGIGGILGILLTVCITPPVAYVVNRWVEKPLLKLKVKSTAECTPHMAK